MPPYTKTKNASDSLVSRTESEANYKYIYLEFEINDYLVFTIQTENNNNIKKQLTRMNNNKCPF